MKRIRWVLLFPVMGAITAVQAFSQNYVYQVGTPNYSTQIPIENGFINVNNGEIHIELPIATHAQRGSIPLQEMLVYDSRIWKIVYSGGNYSWQPTNVANSIGGWRFESGLDAGSVQVFGTGTTSQCPNNGSEWFTYYTYSFDWTDPSGASHWFPVNTGQVTQSSCNWPGGSEPSQPTGNAYPLDESGYFMTVSDYTTAVVYDRTGNQVYPEPQDTNGNYMSSDANGNLVDNLGRTPVMMSTSGNQIFYDVLGWNGTRNRYTVTTETVNYSTAFAQQDVADASGSFTAIQSIELPDNSTYSFTYDSGTLAGHYGELKSVTLPSGGTIQYNWTNFLDSFQNENRWLYQRVKDGGTTTFSPQTISTCSTSNGCQEKMTVTSPSGNDTVYTFNLDAGQYVNASSWNTAIDLYQGSSNGTGTKLKSVDTTYQYITENPTFGPYTTLSSITQTTVLTDVSLTSQSVTAFDSLGVNPVTVQVWDYYSGSAPSTPTEKTTYTNTYALNGASLPTQVSVTDGSNNLVSQTIYSYDQTPCNDQTPPSCTSGLPNHNSVSGNRGNLTTISQWMNTSGSSLFSTTRTYDDAGTVIAEADPNGSTTYSHDSTDTFVTGVTPPTPSSGVTLPFTATYDFSSGLLMSTTDPNLQVTTYKNYDWGGRVGEIDYPDSGKTTFGYTSTQSSVYSYQNSTTYLDTETQFDTYARQSRLAVANGQSGNPWYQQDICYDASGNLSFQSYRYQGNGLVGSTKVCSGSGDYYSYDALGRTTQIAHGDGSGTSIYYAYEGRATRSLDENGISRILQNDGLGRPTGVCEIFSADSPVFYGGEGPSNIGMPSSGSPSGCGLDITGTGYLTNYAYNLSNHTTTVTQGSQTRAFQTDWLGRPTLIQEPESGQTTYSYAYDTIGLAVTRERPAANQTSSSVNTTTTTQYDSVGRVVSVSYTDGTPTKTYTYDTNALWPWTNFTPTNLKGRMYVAYTGSAPPATAYSYDAMGRMVELGECTSSGCGNGTNDKHLSYTYDWLGNTLTAADGAGVTTTYGYSFANEVTSITSSLNDSTHPSALVSNVQNGPVGPLSWQIGNGTAAVRTYDAVGRIGVTWICQGSTQPSCSGGEQLYESANNWTGSYLTLNCDTILFQCNEYDYDQMGRLVSSGDYSWVYDRWGNRWQQNPFYGGGWTSNLTYSANNQITTSGFSYDAAGDLLSDGAHTYTYDAEGNVTQVDPGGSTAKFVYDALNQRVQVDISGDGVNYVFNPNGQRVSYWDVNSSQLLQGQVYWGSSPVEYYSNSVAHFQHQDSLGTERLRTTYNGGVEGTFTSLPFGDGLTMTYGNDYDPYHFAGLDQDYSSDTGHAQFRQYAFASGGWMSPDPYSGSYDFSNPQSFNRYSYVLNKPLSMTDPQGLDEGGLGGIGSAAGSCGVAAGTGGGDLEADFLCGWTLLKPLFGHPRFKGSLMPRPNAQPWDEHGIVYGPNIAGALGLPDAGCEFGACGGLGGDFQNAGTMAGPAIGGAVVCAAAEPCGAIALGVGAAVVIGGAIYEGTQIYRGRTNVSDTGITSEAQQLVSSGKFPSICAALSYLQSTTRDSARLQKIKATQKAFGCRRNSTQS